MAKTRDGTNSRDTWSDERTEVHSPEWEWEYPWGERSYPVSRSRWESNGVSLDSTRSRESTRSWRHFGESLVNRSRGADAWGSRDKEENGIFTGKKRVHDVGGNWSVSGNGGSNGHKPLRKSRSKERAADYHKHGKEKDVELEDNGNATPSSFASLAGDSSRIWPPVLVGKKGHVSNLTEESLEDFLSIEASCLRKYINEELQTLAKKWKTKWVEEPVKDCLHTAEDYRKDHPLYVISTGTVLLEDYEAARYIDEVWSEEKDKEGIRRFTNAGWALGYATVRDMLEMDPNRKLVDWIPLCSSREPNCSFYSSSFMDNSDKINKLVAGTRTHFYYKDLKATIEAIRSALEVKSQQRFVNNSDKEMDEDRYCSNKLEAMINQNFMEPIQKFLVEIHAREMKLRELFLFDGSDHVAETSIEQLYSLGDQMISNKNVEKTFTSQIINRGVELELSTLQSVAKDIQKANDNQQLLTYLTSAHEEAIQKLLVKQKMEMFELLLKSWNESQSLLETRMASRLKLLKAIRSTEEEVSGLTKFLSAGPTKIIEQVHQDALRDQDEQHALDREQEELKNFWEKDDQEQKLKDAKEEVANLSATLKELKESQFNQECCVCYSGLEGFSLPHCQGKSSSAEKLYKRACFLPCMHANVCTKCSENSWKESPPLCPICRQQLTEKPRVIYL